MKIYIETSAILYLLADSDSYKKDRTVEMYEQLAAKDVTLCISQIVKAELSKAPPVMGKCVQAIMDKKKIVPIPLGAGHVSLARGLITSGVLSPAHLMEAFHIAAASKEQCDLLVSWDFETIFNADTLQRLRVYAREQSFTPPTIGNPETLVKAGFGNPKTLQDLRTMRSQFTNQDLEKAIEEIKKSC